MREAIRLFMILLTIVVILLAWITGTLGKPGMQLIIVVMIGTSIVAMVILNLVGSAEERRKRAQRESHTHPDNPEENLNGNPRTGHRKASETDFSLTDRRQGLTWGGGNIHASEARRGTRRRFLGK